MQRASHRESRLGVGLGCRGGAELCHSAALGPSVTGCLLNSLWLPAGQYSQVGTALNGEQGGDSSGQSCVAKIPFDLSGATSPWVGEAVCCRKKG